MTGGPERMSVVFVRMSAGEKQSLRELASSCGVSAPELIRQLIRRALGQPSILDRALPLPKQCQACRRWIRFNPPAFTGETLCDCTKEG